MFGICVALRPVAMGMRKHHRLVSTEGRAGNKGRVVGWGSPLMLPSLSVFQWKTAKIHRWLPPLGKTIQRRGRYSNLIDLGFTYPLCYKPNASIFVGNPIHLWFGENQHLKSYSVLGHSQGRLGRNARVCHCCLQFLFYSWKVSRKKCSPLLSPPIRWVWQQVLLFQPGWNRRALIFQCQGKAVRKNSDKTL